MIGDFPSPADDAGRGQTTAASGPASSFLGQLDDRHRRLLRNLGRVMRLPPGATIRGDGSDDDAHILETGWAKVEISSQDGRIAVARLVGPGELVDDVAVVGAVDAITSTTVTAVTMIEGLAISGDQFREFLREQPDAVMALLNVLAQRLLYGADLRYVGTVAARVARILFELSLTFDDTAIPRISLTQYELASLVGATRESVARVLHHLRRRGIITTSRRQVVLLDRAALSAVINEGELGYRHIASQPLTAGTEPPLPLTPPGRST